MHALLGSGASCTDDSMILALSEVPGDCVSLEQCVAFRTCWQGCLLFLRNGSIKVFFGRTVGFVRRAILDKDPRLLAGFLVVNAQVIVRPEEVGSLEHDGRKSAIRLRTGQKVPVAVSIATLRERWAAR